ISTTRTNQAMPTYAFASGGGGGGGGGGGFGGGGQAIQNSGPMSGARVPGAEKPVGVAGIENQKSALPTPSLDATMGIPRDSIDTSQLVQDGKLLFQLGRSDEAVLK